MIRNRDAGFTAVELLVVLLFAALVLAFLIPVLRERHRDSVFAELTAIADGELEADRRGFDLALNTLDDTDPNFRKVAIDALGGNGFIRSGATPFFMPPWIFAELEGAAGFTVPAVLERLGDFDARVRQAAATTLGNMGRHAAEALPALIGAAEDSDTQVQIVAIRALGYMGSDAKIAYQLLMDREGDPLKEIANAASLARIRIRGALYGEMAFFLSPDLGFFPRTWSPQRKTTFMEHIQFPRYNATSFMGMTLIHARMEIPVSDVDNFLRGHELDSPTFKKMTNAQLIEHCFGRHSGKYPSSNAGEPMELAWWQPGDTNQRTQYSWSSKMPSGPPYRISIQVNRLSLSTAEVHVRITHA